MPTTILLVRHGETEANVKGVLQGQSESDLTAKGRAQAMALGRALTTKFLDADGKPLHRGLAPKIYTSDLRRTVDTSAAIAEAFLAAAGSALTLAKDERLRERRLGPFQGRTQAQCQRELPMLWTRFCADEEDLATSGSGDTALPAIEAKEAAANGGVEPYSELRARANSALRDIAAAHDGAAVLVVSHGGFVHSAVSELAAIDFVPHIGNVSLTTFEVDDPAARDAPWRIGAIGEQLVHGDAVAALQTANVDVLNRR